jgi:hypothetical protein
MYQDEIFERLKQHLNPGGRLYIVGMQPLPDAPPAPAAVISEVLSLLSYFVLLLQQLHVLL